MLVFALIIHHTISNKRKVQIVSMYAEFIWRPENFQCVSETKYDMKYQQKYWPGNSSFRMWKCQNFVLSSLACPSYQYILELTLFCIFREELRHTFSQICCCHFCRNDTVDDIITSLFAYSYWLVKKCFLKICETSKCHNFFIFQPIFIRFSQNMFLLRLS